MFCYQCEQTMRTDNGSGCVTKGTCGKDETTAALQDLLIYAVKGIAQYAHPLRKLGVTDKTADQFILYALFTTLTNVNFNPARLGKLLEESVKIRHRLKELYESIATQKGAPIEIFSGPAAWQCPQDMQEKLDQAQRASIIANQEILGEDVIGLRSLILYGLKGVAAYAYHALMLGYESEEVHAYFARILDWLAQEPTDVDLLLQESLGVGEINLKVMALLDAAHTESFGHPEPTRVRTTPVKGKAILVSGHDMHDLLALLEQTKDTGIHVYTHGELLPAHAYPKLHAYPHLVGNYGGAWQDQISEFANFPGPIFITSNCLIEPSQRYRMRLFTAGPVGWPGIRHLAHGDFAPVIQAAQSLPGFKEDAQEESIMIGFARNALLGAADQVIRHVREGKIAHFFLVGGCDGAAPGRNYFTDLAEKIPQDSVILTLGCGKYRFNKKTFGDINGIPRLLDIGQCNDSYSAIQVVLALAEAFRCDVNELPLSLFISWFEQKAVAVLLTLLHLGIKNIHLGPTLPGFLTPTLLNYLSDHFGLKAVTTPQEDLNEVLKKAA